jgi:hypothetical protein
MVVQEFRDKHGRLNRNHLDGPAYIGSDGDSIYYEYGIKKTLE